MKTHITRSIGILALSLGLISLVLMAPASAQCSSTKTAKAATADKNIVETAEAVGTFNTLITAAKAAGMVGALTQDGPLTVFAPTDAAFAKLPKGTVASLLKDPAKLKAILAFHVVAGQVNAKTASKAGEAKSLLGPKLTFSRSGTGLKVQNADIVSADVKASNGMIHVIDTVLLPPAS
ncbi:MAG: fasciclin domain-containing protein [Myxococcota bacterium]